MTEMAGTEGMADITGMIGITGIISLEIGLLSDLCLRTIMTEDPHHQLSVDRKTYRGILLYCIIVGSWIGVILKHWNWYGQLACGVLAAYLLVASIQDIQSYSVYDFLHAAAVPTGFVFVIAAPDREKLLSLTVFLIIQLGVFMHMYGAADGLVFLVCAVYESRFGKGLLTYLLHMGAAYILLGIVQGIRHNVNRYGNLKEPVAFVPYIAATVWLFL